MRKGVRKVGKKVGKKGVRKVGKKAWLRKPCLMQRIFLRKALHRKRLHDV